jgi:hypothetical protein
MFICLSSGARPRYRQDILRAIAMPSGMRLQFRYTNNIVAPKIIDRIHTGSVKGEKALIAYCDQHDPNVTPEFIPCRYATIEEAEIHGLTVSLVLSLEDFAYTKDIARFNGGLRQAVPSLPVWQPDSSYPAGYYWLETKRDPDIIRSLQVEVWEKIVHQLSQRVDFQLENCYYTILGLYIGGSETAISSQEDCFHLAADNKYEIRVYHFIPEQQSNVSSLRFEAKTEWITFLRNPVLTIDSPYDLKKVLFKTGRPARGEETYISVYRSVGAGSPLESATNYSATEILDFDLPLHISPLRKGPSKKHK